MLCFILLHEYMTVSRVDSEHNYLDGVCKEHND